MTSDLDIYRSANELIKERGLKGASDYAPPLIHTLLEWETKTAPTSGGVSVPCC